MKRLLFVAMFLLWAAPALAVNSTISGVLQNIDGTPCPSCTIFFNSQVTQVITGTTYQPLMKSTTTDGSGNIAAISLPQGLVVQIAVSENGQTFPSYTAIVPFLPAVTFDQLNQGILLEPLNILASLSPPTGPLNMNGQKITNQGCPTTGGDGLVWGCNATVNNLTVTGGFTQNTSGAGFFGRLTVSAISNPATPTGAALGTTGATQYYYFLVCNDGNGGQTLPSASLSIANANATLTSTNKVQINFVIPTHALNCDILRNTTNTSVGAQSIVGGLAQTVSPVFDTSNSTSAYSVPTRNSTGDGVFAGNVTAASATIPTLNGNVLVTGSLTADLDLTTNGFFSAGSAGFENGRITLHGLTSGRAGFESQDIAGTPNLITLPTTNGSVGQFFQTDGTGIATWQSICLGGGYNTGTMGSSTIAFTSLTTIMSIAATAPTCTDTSITYRPILAYHVLLEGATADCEVTNGSVAGVGCSFGGGGLTNSCQNSAVASATPIAQGASVTYTLQCQSSGTSTAVKQFPVITSLNSGMSIEFIPSN